jgi:hypothetical protein
VQLLVFRDQLAEPALKFEAVPVLAFVPELAHSRLRCEVVRLLLDRAPMFPVELPAPPLDARGFEEAEQAADEGEEVRSVLPDSRSVPPSP